MMLNLGRMAFFLLIGLTVVYVSLYFYWRSGIRMRLEEDWVMEGRPGDRDAWVEDRLAPQARRIRRWLVFLVYVLPLAALSVYCLRDQLGLPTMRWPRIIFLSLVILLIGAFLHYTLPQRDVVRIVNAESDPDRTRRLEPDLLRPAPMREPRAEPPAAMCRFINTVEERKRQYPRLPRNEDTSVLWPPYSSSSNSQDLSDRERKTLNLERGTTPTWVSITHLRLAAP